ncbi:DnaJ C-terminal domain-containing protein [Candidatus Coxiella mudrowiae]|uniref:Curved DNA-binding protein n=1 Tax=Candidatus Coxiella mudrowiae TaxID=2054173 RepID=A0ABM5UUI3_9COXI|nr:DnaJ C-terminal domain-containing protein [Candidatus Coxiella mudrowiae]AKQ33655.1 Curved DNA-binding protein [Candidatus Coxiella mudrowiae]
MEYQDYYKILGISRSATADEIKKRYRQLARKYHPDVSKEPNAEEKFKQVKEAYQVLKDPEKRKAYDAMGAGWKQGEDFTPPPGWEFHPRSEASYQEFRQGDFSDFFETLFGVLGAGRRWTRSEFSQRGQDQHSRVTINLEEAFRGTTRTLTFQEPTLNPQTDQVNYTTRTLRVKIPAGVTQGQQIRLQGQGSPGIGGAPNGDLYLEIHLQPHQLYTIEGKNIYLNLPVTPWEAALGSKITVPTLGGAVDLTLPLGSQTGKKLRLKGRGFPGKPPGDQYVFLNIYIPEPKTDQQKQLYQKMSELMHFNPRKELLRQS